VDDLGKAAERGHACVLQALFDAGYIRESNYGDLDKIGWARCSRTDKGVHAARNVLSAKLELKVRGHDARGARFSVNGAVV
jgi:tRNA U38,U39,U40 pseudouridine synthase TruA